MTRLEMLLWTLAVAALAWPTDAQAQSIRYAPQSQYYSNGYYAGAPSAEAFALSVELSREASALACDARNMITDRHDRHEVLDELKDVTEELEDLNEAIEDSLRNSRKWSRVRKRAEDLIEEIEDLDKDIHEAVDDMTRRNGIRREAFVPVGQPHYLSQYRQPQYRQPATSVSIRIGSRAGISINSGSSRTSSRVVSGPTLPPPPGYSQPVYSSALAGNELLNHVHMMQALAQEIHRVAQQ